MKRIGYVLLTGFLFSSCYHNIFLPSSPYAPQLKEKGEAELSVSGLPPVGLQVQGAWAATKRFGVQAQANAISKTSGNVLFGPNFRYQHRFDSVNAFLFNVSAGYSAGMHTRYLTRQAENGIPQLTTDPGYMLYDMHARWQGGYLLFSYGIRLERKLCIYGGIRSQWLDAQEFRYQQQYFTYNDSTSAFTPGQIRTVNPAHGFTTILDNFIGLRFGWNRFNFFIQGQWRYQYNAKTLNNHYHKLGAGTGCIGIVINFGGK